MNQPKAVLKTKEVAVAIPPKKVLKRVVSVSIPNLFIGSENLSPVSFLNEAGFVSINTRDNAVTAMSQTADTGSVILVEHLEQKKKEYVPFRLVRLITSHPPRIYEVDTGMIQLIMCGTEIMAEGSKVSSWEMVVTPTDIADLGQFQRVSEYYDSSKDDTSVDGESPESDQDDEAVPSTVKSMIREAVSRNQLAPAGKFAGPKFEVVDDKPRRGTRFARIEPASLASLPNLGASFCEVRLPTWKRNPNILKFMQENCEGKDTMEAFAVAADKFRESQGWNLTVLAGHFKENYPIISSVMFILKLESTLRPLLDKGMNDPLRMTMREMRILSHFPLQEQPGIWNKVKDAGTRTMIERKLEELAEPYFVVHEYDAKRRVFKKTLGAPAEAPAQVTGS